MFFFEQSTSIWYKSQRQKSKLMFSNSSSNIYLKGTNLCATCLDSKGNKHDSSIDLNNYIGNIEGTLTWGKCNFAASSSNINLSGSIICADCKDSKGNSHHSAIYLDNYISNIEGTLKVN